MLKSASSKRLCKFSDYRIAFIKELSEFCVDNMFQSALNSFSMAILSINNSNDVKSSSLNSLKSYSLSELLEYMLDKLLILTWDCDVHPLVKMIKNLLIMYSTYTIQEDSPVLTKIKPNYSRFSNIIKAIQIRNNTRFAHTNYYRNTLSDNEISLENAGVYAIASVSINNIDNMFSLAALSGNIEIMRLLLLHVDDTSGKAALQFECRGNPITSSSFKFHGLRYESNPIIHCIYSSYFRRIIDNFTSLSSTANNINPGNKYTSQTVLEYLLLHSEFKSLTNMPEVARFINQTEYSIKLQ
jgi:hypothetical protein